MGFISTVFACISGYSYKKVGVLFQATATFSAKIQAYDVIAHIGLGRFADQAFVIAGLEELQGFYPTGIGHVGLAILIHNTDTIGIAELPKRVGGCIISSQGT